MKDWFAQKLKQENKQKNCCMAENCHEQVQNDNWGKYLQFINKRLISLK